MPIKNKLIISWDFFDSGYGFKIQVIYNGTDKTQINVEGSVEGAKIKKENYSSLKDTKRDRATFYIIIIIGILFAGFIAFKLPIKDVKALGVSRYVYFILMIVVIIITLYLATDVEELMFMGEPPF